jgi:DNA repair exonuclease SbcCD nuclease subunit
MSSWPFRFVHAADFHLERTPFGVTEVPDHLRELFLEAAYLAAERVFETALSEQAEFLVLAGDLLNPRWTGPRGLLFLAEQFRRLAERGIAVYWAGGRVDPPDAWPSAVPLPDNVHVFPAGRPQEHVHYRDGTALARVMGISRAPNRGIRVSEFDPDPGGLFSIAVVHGSLDAESLSGRGIDYWALGGSHARHTPFSSPHMAHDPGSPQGRWPGECGPHGCTLVQVEGGRAARTTLVPTDVMRWQSERIAVEEATTPDDLERLLHERMQGVVETAPGMDLLISWTVVGDGPLMAQLRAGPLAGQLLEKLRTRYGFGPPAAWSLSLSAEPAAMLAPEWYEQETIRGDFLRELRHLQIHPSESLELQSYLSRGQEAGTLGVAADLDQVTRERVLREAALLGIDLLSGEEPEP